MFEKNVNHINFKTRLPSFKIVHENWISYTKMLQRTVSLSVRVLENIRKISEFFIIMKKRKNHSLFLRYITNSNELTTLKMVYQIEWYKNFCKKYNTMQIPSDTLYLKANYQTLKNVLWSDILRWVTSEIKKSWNCWKTIIFCFHIRNGLDLSRGPTRILSYPKFT